MKRESSYQRRLRDIKFYEQRGKELEDIVEDILVLFTKKTGILPQLPLPRGMNGDNYLNDINSGEFWSWMINKVKERLKKGEKTQ